MKQGDTVYIRRDPKRREFVIQGMKWWRKLENNKYVDDKQFAVLHLECWGVLWQALNVPVDELEKVVKMEEK